jgi:hypothetical protein
MGARDRDDFVMTKSDDEAVFWERLRGMPDDGSPPTASS